ncbi:MAG: protein kinase [Planctomycetota bacterium]|nr:protein kinase [Planctomycetota bacterium]
MIVEHETPAEEVAKPQLPVIPGFESVEYIGEGGMGEVLLARSRTSQETVAIKLLKTSVDSVSERDRFARESKLTSELDHPNLVKILDQGSVDGRDYFIMEYVDGGPLRQAIEKPQPMNVSQVRDIIDGVAQALEFTSRPQDGRGVGAGVGRRSGRSVCVRGGIQRGLSGGRKEMRETSLADAAGDDCNPRAHRWDRFCVWIRLRGG